MVDNSLFSIVADMDRHDFEQSYRRVFEGVEDTVRSTYVGRSSDGSLFPVDVFIRKVRQRKKTRLMVTVHDVTEREQAHELLRKRVREKTEHLSSINMQLREEIQERQRIEEELVQAGKLAALGQFSAGIAHELNQPLSAIRYLLHNAEKLLDQGKAETHKENLVKIEELVVRMAKMINHLKTFARFQPDTLDKVSVNQSIDRALELLSGKVEKVGAKVNLLGESGGVTAYADSARLEQVLVNILSNGLDAAALGDEEAKTISVTVTEQEQYVLIEVCDSGSGIEADPPETVFDPFYTTKEVGRGLGLGLSIAYNLVKGFGGGISAANSKQGGACFTITLKNGKEPLS
jgi:two-component system, NtrC family, phosphoglycerate transport system sensor histidine kinase PgtB